MKKKKKSSFRLFFILVLLFTCFFNLNAQAISYNISGVVTDEAGEVLTGVTIKQEATNAATSTDVDGKFELKVGDPSGVISVLYLGYIPQEIKLEKSKSYYEIRLKQDEKTLEEVIVVGYGIQKKINLSGAVQAVSGSEIAKRPISNVTTGLQGMIPNLNISLGSGRSTDAPSLNIRGMTSINGGSAFILIDNMPSNSGELARLNPEDIESVTVLKDASSAAIYGARAAFGVVLVTTKRGTSGKKELQINFNGNYAWRTRGQHPKYVTDTYTVMNIKNQAAWPLYNLYDDEVLEYAKQVAIDPTLPRVRLNPTSPENWQYFGATDWQDEVYNGSAPAYTANVSASKSDERHSFYISAGYYRQDGLIRYGTDVLKRYNFRTNTDFKILKNWKVGGSVSYMTDDYDSPNYLDGIFFHNVNRLPSFSVPRNPDGTWTSDGAALLGAIQEGGRRKTRNYETQLSFNTQVDIIKDRWRINADANFRRNNANRDTYNLSVMYRNGPNLPLEPSLRDRGSKQYARLDNWEDRYDVYNVFTTFTKTFDKQHNFTAMVGYERELTDYRSYWTQREDLISSSLPELGLATGTTTNGNSRRQLALEGVFGRVNYIFDSRYILEFNGRYDGSSRFPSGDRWGFFPSGSVAWLLGNEKFFEGARNALQISNLKFRFSYGALGNQNIEAYYPFSPTLGRGTSSVILDGEFPLYLGVPGLVSDSFTWEKVRTINAGMDLNLFNNKFDLALDIYKRYTDDMLTNARELPAVLGTKAPQTNSADLETKGWELSIGWRDAFTLANSPFSYSIKFSIADNQSKITKFDNPSGSYNNYYVGKKIGEIWGLVNDGFFQSQEDLKNSPDQTAVGTDDQSYKFYVGDSKYKDLNKDGKITYGNKTLKDPGDAKIIGNSSARYPYSFDLNASWKGFDLRMFFQGIGKRDWYAGAGNFYFWGIYAQPWTNVTEKNMDHWTEDNRNAYFPRVKAYSAEDNNELGFPQTKYLQDASYLRLKNLTLGYTLPKTWLGRLKMNNVRLYFSAENLITWHNMDVELDPEVSTTTNAGKVYPMQKTFSFGLNVGF